MASIPKMIVYYVDMLIYPGKMAIWQNWVVKKLTFTDFYPPLLICAALATIYKSGQYKKSQAAVNKALTYRSFSVSPLFFRLYIEVDNLKKWFWR